MYKVESRTFRDAQMRDGRDVVEYLNDKEIEGWDLVGIMQHGYSNALNAFVFKKRPICVGKHNGPIVMDDDN